jgi:phosphoribosylanthranilate isomerase
MSDALRFTRIKLCGITSCQDAALAVEAGAHYLGMIFVPHSPRCVRLSEAKAIVQAVKGAINVVGVFQNPTREDLEAVLSVVDLETLQLHGDEPPALYRDLPIPVIKALPLLDPDTSGLCRRHTVGDELGEGRKAPTFLFDTPKGSPPPQWDNPETQQQVHKLLSACLPQGLGAVPHFLAGGLTPENVGLVLEAFQPWGVDVASGVEQAPGHKDPDAVVRFCQAVREWDARHVPSIKKGGSASCAP